MAGIEENASLEAMLKALQSVESTLDAPEDKEIVRIAGTSLHFIHANGQWQDFQRFLRESDMPLSKEQVRRLRSLGIQAWPSSK